MMTPTVFDLLDEAASGIAGAINDQLEAITRYHYANWLSVLSWYMDGNGLRHLIEAEKASNSPGLRAAFREHGEDEDNHWQFALRDLEALGLVRTPNPPEEVVKLHRCVDSWDAPRKLGYSAMVETMAVLIAPSALDMKERLKLSEDQFTCCALHIELDSGPEGHGLKQRRVAAEHLKEGQWVPFVEGALEGGRMWGEMMIVALRTPLYASLAFSSKKSS
jgi:hypothetical protein